MRRLEEQALLACGTAVVPERLRQVVAGGPTGVCSCATVLALRRLAEVNGIDPVELCDAPVAQRRRWYAAFRASPGGMPTNGRQLARFCGSRATTAGRGAIAGDDNGCATDDILLRILLRRPTCRPATRAALQQLLSHPTLGAELRSPECDGPALDRILTRTGCGDFRWSSSTMHAVRSILFALRRHPETPGWEAFRSHLWCVPAALMQQHPFLWQCPHTFACHLHKHEAFEQHGRLVQVVRLVVAGTVTGGGSSLGSVIGTVCRRFQEVLHYGVCARQPFPPEAGVSAQDLRRYAAAVAVAITPERRYNRCRKLLLPLLQKCVSAGVFDGLGPGDAPTVTQLHAVVLHSPVTGAALPGDALTDRLVERLLAACVTTEERLFVTLSATTGLRARAVSLLRMDQVYDAEEGCVRRQIGVPEKGGKVRQIWPGKELQRCFAAHFLERSPAENTFVFPNKRNRDEASSYFAGNMMRTLCHRAGLPRVFGHHTFRCYVVHRCLEHGMDIDTLAQWLGHSSARLTYQHYWCKHTPAAFQPRLNPNVPAAHAEMICDTFGFAPSVGL